MRKASFVDCLRKNTWEFERGDSLLPNCVQRLKQTPETTSGASNDLTVTSYSTISLRAFRIPSNQLDSVPSVVCYYMDQEFFAMV